MKWAGLATGTGPGEGIDLRLVLARWSDDCQPVIMYMKPGGFHVDDVGEFAVGWTGIGKMVALDGVLDGHLPVGGNGEVLLATKRDPSRDRETSAGTPPRNPAPTRSSAARRRPG